MDANFTPDLKRYNKLSPFKLFIIEKFPFLEDDFDAITEWQLLQKLGEAINKLIQNNDNVTSNTQELYNSYVKLQDYVNDYFTNLDVQDEINIKLNDMADSGTLQAIISDYLNSKAVFCFENVAEMLNSNNLTSNSYAQTLGFYTKNDGGNALYKIRNITNKDIIDNMFILPLANNNLIAELICDSEINIKKLGCTQDNDCKNAIVSAMNKNINVLIPRGTWLCSPFSMVNGGCIRGLNLNYQVVANNSSINEDISVLQCMTDCDTFIDCSNCDHIILEIAVSSCKSKGDYLNAKNVGQFLKLDHTTFSTFDLFILCINNYGMSYKDSWENTFKRLYFRGILNNNVTNIKCLEGTKGISQTKIFDLQSEGFGATILDTSEHCLFYHNKIESILLELTPYTPFVDTTESATQQIPLFKIGSGSNNIIDSIQLNNYSSKNALLEAISYEHSLFEINNNNNYSYGFIINNIVFDTGVQHPIQVINQNGNSESDTAYLIINNITTPMGYVMRYNMNGMNYLRVANIYNKFLNTSPKLNNNYTITTWYMPEHSGKTPLISDNINYNSLNNESSVAKISNEMLKIGTLRCKTGDNIKIYYKSDSEINYTIKLMQRNNTVLKTIEGTLPSKSTYQISDLITIEDNGLFIATFSFSSAGESYIADIIK